MTEARQLGRIVSHRLPSLSLRNVLCAFPASLLLLAVICSLSAWTGRYSNAEYLDVLRRFGLAWHDVHAGHPWHLFTGEWIQSSPGLEWSMVAMLVGALLPCELLAGSWRLLVTFLAGDWISSLLTVVAMRLLAAAGVAEAVPYLHTHDAGSSAGAHAAFAVSAALLPGRLALPAWLGLLGITIAMFWYQDLDAALVHLVAVLVGGAVAWRAWRREVLAERASESIPARQPQTAPIS
jgi:hypothetical protein